MNIAIIYGGRSGEHEVSLVSASGIVRNIDLHKHTVYLIGVTKTGFWYLQPEEERLRITGDTKAVLNIQTAAEHKLLLCPGGGTGAGIQTKTGPLPVDIAFLVLHGTYGEDGTIQGLLDMTGIPYTGCGCFSSAAAMDKEKAKLLWKQAGLPVLPHVCIRRNESAGTACLRAEQEFGYPLFVKPCSAGSSVGAAKAVCREELEKAVADAFCWDDKILIEPAVQAREIECSVTGNSVTGPEPAAYVPGEIKPTHVFYDYDAKYTDPDGAALCIPAEITPEQIEVIRKTAVKAYSVLDCSGLSRVDFFIDTKTGCLYLNELNTMPGFTPISMFPKMCEAGGLSYSDLIELLIQEGLERSSARNRLQTSR